MANPIAKPDPDIPIKCSAEILLAMREAPIAQKVSDPSARKNPEAVSDLFVFFRYIQYP
jgi:hypothetical protein